jgi:hypothetical protein
MKKVSGAGTAGRYHYANQDLKAFLDLAIPPGAVPEKAWGPDHTSTLDTVNNFLLYADQGKLDEAKKMYQRALQV